MILIFGVLVAWFAIVLIAAILDELEDE